MDFPRWTHWFIIPSPNSGWGTVWEINTGAGRGTRLLLSRKDRPLQAFHVTTWEHPRCLKLHLTDWTRRKFIRGGGGMMSGIIAITLTPVSRTETRLDMELESRFVHPLFGPLLNTFLSVESRLKTIIDGFFRKFPKSLDASEAAAP